MATLNIQHGAIPQYLPKKITVYKYVERGATQTIDYVYSDNPEIIGVTRWGIDQSIASPDKVAEELYGFMGFPNGETQTGIGLENCIYTPYRPHTEIYHSNCVPYYVSGVQVGWQETAESTRTNIIVLDDWQYYGGSDGIQYDRDSGIYTYTEWIKGVKDTATEPYHTVISSDIQYLGRLDSADFEMNRTIYDINGNQIGSASPTTLDRENKITKTWAFTAGSRTAADIQALIDQRTTRAEISSSLTAQAVTASDVGMVWALSAPNRWSMTMPENGSTTINFPSPLPLILVPYTNTQDIVVYDMQLDEQIEP